MNLLKKVNIVKMYRKNGKKSISFPGRIERVDVFIFVSALILIITPIIVNFVFRLNTDSGQMELLLSPRSEELFGRETTETLLRDYGERNPDLRIRPGNNPDILIFDEGDYNSLVAAGTLASLKQYIHAEGGAEQLAIPLVSFMDLLFYNIELLKNAGFDRPPKTRNEFVAYTRAVSGGDDVSGAAIGLSPDDNRALFRDIFSWIWAAGGDFWPKADSLPAEKPVFNNRSIISDISFLSRLNSEGLLAPHSFEMTGAQRLEEFSQGKIAMMVASTRDIPALRKKMGEGAFGITVIPGSGSAGKYSIGISSYYAGISAECAYPDEAWSFLVFLKEQSPLLCAGLKAVPGAVSDFISGDYIRDDPFYSKAWDIFESSEIVQGFSGKARGEEFENIIREEIQIFFESSRTAEETAGIIQQRWDAVSLQN